MAKKKVSKSPARRSFRSRRSSAPRPRSRETVRVKTFIVEKPVYVRAPREGLESVRRRIVEDAEPEDDELYSAEESRYAKKRRGRLLAKRKAQEEEALDAGEEFEEDGGAVLDEGAGEVPLEGDDLGELPEEELSEEELAEAEGGVGASGVGGGSGARSHYRSHGLFHNVWWKKGILWGFLFWLLIVAFAYLLDLFKMVSEVTSKENWFFLLIIFIAASCVFHRFYNKSDSVQQ